MDNEFEYLCENCGEPIVVPLDLSAGREQEFVEDCPVCCSPSLIQIHVDRNGRVVVSSRAEQDRY